MTKKWLIAISGFTQSEASENGVLNLSEKLCRFRQPNTAVRYCLWHEDFSGVANHIAAVTGNVRHFEENEKFEPTILIFGYSYGGGRGAPNLVAELKKRGLFVNAVVLSDPVWRLKLPFLGRSGRWFEMIGSFLALTTLGWVGFAKNAVGTIDWFYQREGIPYGKHPVCKGAKISDGILLEVEHSYMDDAQEFHKKCLEVAERFCGEDGARA